jgi:two-component system response regulator NreC
MNKIRVLLAEDHTIVRKGLRSLLDGEAGIQVVGEAADGREAVAKVGQLLPDIVLMDIAMPGLNGLEATRQIRKQFPKVKVLILTILTMSSFGHPLPAQARLAGAGPVVQVLDNQVSRFMR